MGRERFDPSPLLALLALTATPSPADPIQLSGIYPHLAMFNSQRECGTGAVDDLWKLGKVCDKDCQ